jgi:hypothetical protein
MRKTSPVLLLLLVALGLGGCPTNTQRDSGTPPNDANTGGVDMGTPEMDSGGGTPDTGIPPTSVSIASIVNPAAADHPAPGAIVSVTGPMVALTTRLLSSTSTTTGRCTFSAWVGTAGGGDFSGVQVVDSFIPAAGMDCFSAPAQHIPDTLMIGDSVTAVIGDFSNYCPGSNCPANTAQELNVTSGTFTVGAHSGDPTSTTVAISDIAGVALEVGARGAALQGAVVTIQDVEIVDPPRAGVAPAGNNNVMTVAAAGTTTPVMHIQVSKYSGVGCQRMVLAAGAAGDSVGDITGVLQYSFNQWTIQVRQSSDLPSIMCADAGTGTGADAGP